MISPSIAADLVMSLNWSVDISYFITDWPISLHCNALFNGPISLRARDNAATPGKLARKEFRAPVLSIVHAVPVFLADL